MLSAFIDNKLNDRFPWPCEISFHFSSFNNVATPAITSATFPASLVTLRSSSQNKDLVIHFANSIWSKISRHTNTIIIELKKTTEQVDYSFIPIKNFCLLNRMNGASADVYAWTVPAHCMLVVNIYGSLAEPPWWLSGKHAH